MGCKACLFQREARQRSKIPTAQKKAFQWRIMLSRQTGGRGRDRELTREWHR